MALREVREEELLGRKPIHIELESVADDLRGKSVMVTGAAGSIGSELSRQILKCGPRALVCVDQNETGMFYLREELRASDVTSHVFFYVANVTDLEAMRFYLSNYDVDHIFHAAAYKHLSMMEENPAEALRNNALAVKDLLEIAEQGSCKSFVLISSDKAVNPASVMGASKRICELLITARPKTSMQCISVRFGNVLGSSGSVLRIFREQLRLGKCLTVTDPEVRRFFMTAQEAVSLVLQASAIGADGDILVLDMGRAIRIVDMARRFIRLSGTNEDSVEIHFTGLRPGEKLEEELFSENERVSLTSYEKIRRVCSSRTSWPLLCQQLEDLRAVLHIEGASTLRARIKEIVPEYHDPRGTKMRGHESCATRAGGF